MHREHAKDADLRRLSEAQLGIWFAQMLNANKSLYNIGEALEILGALDIGLFESALRQVVGASDSLHLQFIETEDGPRQFISPKVDWSLPIIDLRAEPDASAAAVEWMQRAMARPVDLARDALFDFAVLQTASDRFIWYSRYHHLCNDGFGTSLIGRRVAALYTRLAEGRPSEPPPTESWLTLLDKDDAYRRSSQYQRDRDFWRSQLAERPDRVTVAGLPPSWPDSFIRSTLELAPDDADALRSLGARYRMSLPQVLTAAAAIYTHRISGAPSMILGSAVAARPDAEMQRIVGMVSNVVPVRVDIDPAGTLGSLLRQVSRRMLEAMLHQRYRMEDMRRDLSLRPSEPEIFGPLINVCAFDYDIRFAGYPVRARNVGNWRVDDLEINFYDRRDASGLWIEFCGNPDLYAQRVLSAHVQRFVRLLKTIAKTDPEFPLHRLDILGPEERHQVLEVFNETTATYPSEGSIHALFEKQVEHAPDATALVYGDQSLTYAQLNGRANQLAHHLIGLGVALDSRVAICLERGLDMVVALLGVLKAGGAYVPLDPNYPTDRLAYMLKDSAPVALLTQSNLRGNLPDVGLPVLALDEPSEASAIARQATSNPVAVTRTLTSRNLAYVIYTSGSTGQPKGVMIEHGNVVRLLSATHHWFKFDGTDVWSLFHSFAFDFSVWEIWGALAYGGRLVVISLATARSAEDFYQLLCEEGVTVLNQTPSAFRQLIAAQAQSQRQHRLRYVVFGGEALETGMLKPWYERNGERARLINMYGITETTVHVTYRELTPADCLRAGPSPIGRRIPDLRMYILDENRQPVPIGVTGEIYVGGAGVARGYLNRAELTAERFVADPFCRAPNARMYRTGDLGRWLGDGDMEYLGRNDFQVKIRGFRIELGEIEAKLTACSGVRAAVVVAREDRPGDKRLVAYLVGDDDGEPTAAELRKRLLEVLPEYMVPSAFVMMPALPLTHNGKLDRNALPVPSRGAVAMRGENAPPVEIAAELRKDPRVLEAAVTYVDQGERRSLVAYVLAREEERSRLQDQETMHWQELYDVTYAAGATAAGDFNISGWNSSYTGEPIAPEEMRLWVEEQTTRIRDLHPRRVLEIGCGTGLLLTRLAGSCESYVGLDFSGEVLAQLGRYLRQRPDLSHVALRRGAAHELSFMADDSVDLVILNSVVQYFPDIDYLLEVLAEAVRVTSRDGHIFLGDIRNLLLLDAYHASVQLHKAPAKMPLEELRNRIARSRQNEEELLVDPALFGELVRRWDKLGRFEMTPKTASYDNELSRFRYDVTLTVGEKQEAGPPQRWLTWDASGTWRQVLRKELAVNRGASIGLRGTPDWRVTGAVAASRLLRDVKARVADAGELRSATAKLPGEDPGELVRFARQEALSFRWQGIASDGTYEGIFNARWRPIDKTAAVARNHYRRFANDHLESRGDKELAQALRRRLRESLPEHLVPSSIMVLREWPLTPSGKLDYQALPVPEYLEARAAAGTGGIHRAPRTPTEDLLAAIWAETLGLEQVGIDENFFDLGGHSLLAMQLFTRIRKVFGRNLPMASLFETPTISRMAAALEKEGSRSSWASLRAIRSEGSLPPLFLVPGIGGNVICYYHLTQFLGDQQPVYGLQSRGLDGMERPLTRMTDIAAQFVRELRAVQPKGPYYLGGSCVGGVMAFEMAQQLVVAGEEVAMLALLETWPPSAHRANLLQMYLPPFFGIPVAFARGIGRFARALPRIRPNQWLDQLRRKWRASKEILRGRDANPGEMAELYTDVVSRSNYWAMFKYFPKVFPGRLVLILASERPMSSGQDQRLSWRRFAQKECHVHYSGGGDSGIMLSPPFVQQLAHVLELELALARGGRGSRQGGDGGTKPGAARAAESAGVPQEAESAWS